jgi:membrane protein implicated in regulation of membrane protease activity
MTEWNVWFALAGSMVVLEMFTGTFYLLMIALGLAAGGLAALAGLASAWQFIAAAVVGAAATFSLRRSGLGKREKIDAAQDPAINLDIGQTVAVHEWIITPDGLSTARVMYRGAMWDIELAHGAIAREGMFIIREVRGNRLVVANNGSDSHLQGRK